MKEYDFNCHFFLVSEHCSGQRIDNFLHTYLKNIPRSMIYRIIRTGKIRVNKKIIKFQYKLKVGDLLKIPAIKNIKIRQFYKYDLKEVVFLKDFIIYEDDYLLALNKPPGIDVHGGGYCKLKKINIIDGLRTLYIKNQFLELIHRLDRDTSGILLIAKNRFALTFLHEQFRLQQIQKEYLALVYGSWKISITSVSIPLIKIKNYFKKTHMVCVDLKSGKFSKTFFQVQEYFGNLATLLKIKPITGRTHQIRAHTKHVKHPILGDRKYGNFKINTQFKNLGLNRLLLHASVLCFNHPSTKERLRIYAPIDQEFSDFLFSLRQKTDLL